MHVVYVYACIRSTVVVVALVMAMIIVMRLLVAMERRVHIW